MINSVEIIDLLGCYRRFVISYKINFFFKFFDTWEWNLNDVFFYFGWFLVIMFGMSDEIFGCNVFFDFFGCCFGSYLNR